VAPSVVRRRYLEAAYAARLVSLPAAAPSRRGCRRPRRRPEPRIPRVPSAGSPGCLPQSCLSSSPRPRASDASEDVASSPMNGPTEPTPALRRGQKTVTRGYVNGVNAASVARPIGHCGSGRGRPVRRVQGTQAAQLVRRTRKLDTEQGQADATDDVLRKTKNINMSERRVPEVVNKGGMQVKAVAPDSGRGLKIRSIKKI